MFGWDWEQAQATVVAVKDLSNWSGDPDSQITLSRPHEYVVDVRPDEQPPFRATFRDPYVRGSMDHPVEGQVINVLYQPTSHKVKLIAEEWKYTSGKSKDGQRAEGERFGAAQHGAPGEAAAPLPGGSSSDRITEIGARYERGELTDAQYEAAMEEFWARELKLPKRKHT